MSRAIAASTVLVVVAIVLVAGVAVGYSWGRFAPPSGAGGPAPPVLSILAAGTLGVPFAAVAAFTANTSQVAAPSSAQQYEGSLAVVNAVAAEPTAYAAVGTADYRLIPESLEPGATSWEAVFASSSEVLVYDPTVSALSGITTANWPETVLASGLPLGLANASTDPNGYNEIFVLELEGLLEDGSTASLYGHFFTTPVGALAEPNPSTTRIEPESNVAALLATHAIALFITYRSYAVSNHLTFVDLDPSVNLGATDAASLDHYALASTTILSGAGTKVVRGAPVLFAVTVPSGATGRAAGLAFVEVLLAPAGAALLAADGLTPVSPAWCDRTASAPGALQAFLAPLPSPLAALLDP